MGRFGAPFSFLRAGAGLAALADNAVARGEQISVRPVGANSRHHVESLVLMTFLFARSRAAGTSPAPNPMDDREALSDLFRPVVAGARARGVADAFDLLGIDAVLIDATGRVLHAGGNVRRALAPAAEIVHDHLLGRDPAVNEALQGLIARAIDAPGSSELGDEVVIAGGDQTCGLRIRAIRYPVGEDVQSQLLKAVLIISSVAPGTEYGRGGPA